MVELLIKSGAQIDLVDRDRGHTAFELANYYGNEIDWSERSVLRSIDNNWEKLRIESIYRSRWSSGFTSTC